MFVFSSILIVIAFANSSIFQLDSFIYFFVTSITKPILLTGRFYLQNRTEYNIQQFRTKQQNTTEQQNKTEQQNRTTKQNRTEHTTQQNRTTEHNNRTEHNNKTEQ